MTSTYISSKGQAMKIADMAYPYLCSALAKLERDQPERSDEIDAMRAEVAKRDAAHAEATASGSNLPPEPVETTPAPQTATIATFDAVKAHLLDLYDEARNWLDGAQIETQAQADTLGRLMDELRKGHRAADEARKLEAKPFDDGKKAVQEKYKPILTDAERAIEVAKSALAKWLMQQEEERRRIAAEARARADEEARKAAEAARAAAQTDDLEAKEAAEQIVTAARIAEAQAKRAETARPQTTGGARAISLRTYYRPELADYFAALEHYSANRSDEVEAFLLDLARKDIAAGKRQIPGITVVEEQRAA